MRSDLKLIPALFVLSFRAIGWAQSPASQVDTPQRGIVPTGSYTVSQVESISNTFGGLNLSIPVGGMAPGRAGFSYPVNLYYNSQIYDTYPADEFYATAPVERTGTRMILGKDGGWQYGYQYKVISDQRLLTAAQSTCSLANLSNGNSALSQPPGEDQLAIKKYRLRVVFPDGSVHTLHPKIQMIREALSNTPTYIQDLNGDGFYNVSINRFYVPLLGNDACTTTGGFDLPEKLVYYTTDGTYVRMEFQTKLFSLNQWLYFSFEDMNWTLHFPDGHRVNGRGGFSYFEADRNNNAAQVISTIQNGFPAVTISDQLGRSVLLNYGANQDQIISKGFNGVSVSTLVNWTSFSLSNSLEYDCTVNYTGSTFLPGDCPATGIANPSVALGALPYRMVSTIQLPTNGTGAQDFSFKYSGQFFNTPQGWGELYEMNLPSGLKVNYNYLYDGQFRYSLKENPIVSKVVTDSNGTETYTYTTCGSVDPFYCGTRSESSPDGLNTQYKFLSAFGIPYPPLVHTVISPSAETRKVWAYSRPFPRELYQPNTVQRSFQFDNPYPQYEYKIPKANGLGGIAAATRLTIDINGNTRVLNSTDWIQESVIPPAISGLWQPISGTYPSGRIQINTYAISVPDAVSPSSSNNHVDAYWNENTSSPRTTLNALTQQTVNSATTVFSKTEFDYYDPRTKANIQNERHFKDAFNYVQTSKQYDSFGNVTRITDGNNVVTDITYATIDGFPDAFPQTHKQAFGTSNQLQTDFTYDRYTGRVKQATAYRSPAVQSTFATKTDYTYDVFGRALSTTQTGSSPGLSDLKRSTATTYNDGQRNLVSRKDLNTLGDVLLQSSQFFDQKYRPASSLGIDDNGAFGIRSDQNYLATTSGSHALSSTPYRTTADATFGWNYTQTDTTGRTTASSHYPGNNKPVVFGGTNTTPSSLSTVTYNIRSTLPNLAFETTVTTKGGAALTTTSNPSFDMSRTTGVDAFGQITSVSESGSALSTSYTYDPAGRLTTVTQSSGSSIQKRVFKYDWMGRLTDVYQPETTPTNPGNPEFLPSGVAATPAFKYEYDNNSNLKKRTDARNVITNYTYDELNRLTGKTYQNAPLTTPSVEFLYSGPDLLQSVRLGGVTAATYTYDQLGRVLTSSQTTNGTTYSFGSSATDPGYKWNLADHLTQVKYPGGKVVAYTASPANRYTGLTVNGTHYVSSAAYTPAGALKQMTLGSTAVETRAFNSLGQIESIKVDRQTTNLLTLTNNYTTTNTGNLDDQKINPLGTQQYFSYNTKNQLTGVQEKTLQGSLLWQEAYGATDFGNHYTTAAILTGGTRPNSASYFDLSNRLSGVVHDDAGNQTEVSPFTATYDGESRQSGVTSSSNGSATYSYNGDGRRVTKVANGATTVFVYDALGRLAQEYSTAPVLLGGTRYLTPDQLGSTRMVTDATGGDVRLFDYLPFGEEIPTGFGGRTTALGFGKVGTTQKFTGQQRDGESGLDFFEARYLSGAMGRFTSPDPEGAGAMSDDPQSWSMYAYGRNNPMKYTDPTGTNYTVCLYGSCQTWNDNQWDTWRSGQGDSIIFRPGGDILDRTTEMKIGKAEYYDEKPLEALILAGNRAKRDVSTSAILIGAFATAYISTYAAPALLAAVAFGSELGEIGAVGANLLPPKARGLLGTLLPLAGETVAKVIRQRGGGQGQVNQVATNIQQMTLGEVAKLAAYGEGKEAAAARTAIHVAKNASAQFQKYQK